MNIVVYTKSGCPNCEYAKNLLKSKGVQYTEVNAEFGSIMTDLLRSHPEARQMPQIFINKQRIGGLAGLQVALKELGL